MCGISGLFSNTLRKADAEQITARMAEKIRHRGPDGSGLWQNDSGRITLAHLRLAILDLTPSGMQPMHSASKRYSIAFNGEIYNYLELKKDLAELGHRFRGTSDTEVLLASFDQWGIEATLGRLVGMFAIALWDHQQNRLSLMRDRAGEKPLYYGYVGHDLLFSSELKSFTAHPNWQMDLDRSSLALFFRHNYIPAPFTIYRHVFKLRPGHLIHFNLDQTLNKTLAESSPYWRLSDHANAAISDLSDVDAISFLENQLKETVRHQMLADVPVGCFLSGGVDSSTIAAIMQSLSPRPIKTFTIGFSEDEFNEAPYAKAVSQHLGTDHTEHYVSAKEALEVIPLLPHIYDEPFSDSSQVPTHLVSVLARQQVTVSLSGDAGDELFAGYNRYNLALNLWRKLSRVPGPIRRSGSQFLSLLGPQTLTTLYQASAAVLPSRYRVAQPNEKIVKGLRVLGLNNFDDVYEQLLSHWSKPEELVLNANEPKKWVVGYGDGLERPDPIEKMMYIDTLTYLPDDILCKVDRAAMATSLETRAPLLDHRLIEWAWSLPMKFKIRDGQSKWLLRQVLYKYIPSNLIERPKMGFGVPIDHWLRGPLRDWAEELLSPDLLNRQGYLHADPIQKKWRQHLNGEANWQYHLWDVLMFQQWLRTQL